MNPNFRSVALNRKGKKGGGILIFLNNRYAIRSINKISGNSSSMESNTLNILCNNESLAIIAIYRPPERNKIEFSRNLQSMLEKKNITNPSIILGDMNIDLMNKSEMDRKIVTDYENLLAVKGFKRVIWDSREEFRMNGITQSCIDHLFIKHHW